MAKDYIEQRDGNYYVAGTRVSLDSIVHAFRRGESPETLHTADAGLISSEVIRGTEPRCAASEPPTPWPTTGSEIPLLMHHRVYHSELAAIRRFFKETMDPYGLRAADLNALIRSAGQRIAGWPEAERNRLCTELLKSGRFEEGQIALVVYRRFRRSCGQRE